ncbi:MAG TPA: hypothetical protein VFT65_15795 [Candidatus Angelobacter sp.]|nr:hypothetical protein [Candidatus Angelobacter sp.]
MKTRSLRAGSNCSLPAYSQASPTQQQSVSAVETSNTVTEQGINLQSTKVSQALGKGPATIRKSLAGLVSW